MRKRNVSIWITIALCFVILAQTTTVSAVSHTKVWLGTGLITAGIVLSARAIDDFCLGAGCEGRGEGELIAGVAMVGVGAILLVMGLQDDDENGSSMRQVRSYNQPVVVGFGPVKNGWAGAVRIRW
jgi:hypothetical protein